MKTPTRRRKKDQVSSSETSPAQLVTEAVSVCCPYCGEPQPNPSDGSEQWMKSDFERFNKEHGVGPYTKDCVSCDAQMFIFGGGKAQFI